MQVWGRSTIMPRRAAYPHSPPHFIDLSAHAAPTTRGALPAQVVAPLEPVHHVVRQNHFALDMQLVLGTEERVRVCFHRDGHVERVLHNEGAVVQVRHFGFGFSCNEDKIPALLHREK